jgi:hypothetical protein
MVLGVDCGPAWKTADPDAAPVTDNPRVLYSLAGFGSVGCQRDRRPPANAVVLRAVGVDESSLLNLGECGLGLTQLALPIS